MQGPYLRKRGVQTTIPIQLFEVDGIDFRIDAVDGGTDSFITKDEGSEVNCVNDFIDRGNGYSLVLTATEMEAARISVNVIDQSGTKVWLDTTVVIETYGNASAQHIMDFSKDITGSGFDSATSSLQAIRERGDAAWGAGVGNARLED